MRAKKLFAVMIGIIAVVSCSQVDSVSTLTEAPAFSTTRSEMVGNYTFDNPEIAAVAAEMFGNGVTLPGDQPQNLFSIFKGSEFRQH